MRKGVQNEMVFTRIASVGFTGVDGLVSTGSAIFH
jgi:hypothetical protein